MKKLIFLLLLSIASLLSFSQDIIIQRNNSRMEVKILEITSTEVKFKLWGNQDGPMNAMRKNEIHKIIYKNGTEQMFSPMFSDANRSYEKRRNAGAAFALSILYPGMGQYYNKDNIKGIAMMTGYTAGIVLLAGSSDLGWSGAPIAAGVFLFAGSALWSIIDAPIRATIINHKYNLASKLSNEQFDLKIQPNFTTLNTTNTFNLNQTDIVYGARLTISLK